MKKTLSCRVKNYRLCHSDGISPTVMEAISNAVKVIQRGNLLIIPRVTDMGKGMYRPEVVYSKGRASDIILGESFDNLQRARLMAELSASAVLLNEPQMDVFWQEITRAVHGCGEIISAVMSKVC